MRVSIEPDSEDDEKQKISLYVEDFKSKEFKEKQFEDLEIGNHNSIAIGRLRENCQISFYGDASVSK